MMPELISLALILDFSGSMDQKLLDRTKKSILVENVAAFSSTLRPAEKVWVVSYGSGPATSCGQVTERTDTRATLGPWVKTQEPGKFAATPLAYAILQVKKGLETRRVRRLIVITDGNDTCKQDVCGALGELDKALRLKRATMQVDLLGYDLSIDEEKGLKCKSTKLRNVGFHAISAKSDVQFAKEFEEIDHKAKARERLHGKASVRVVGAPSSMSFEAVPIKKGHGAEKWEGPFAFELDAGAYEIEIPELEGAHATVKLRANQKKSLDFYRDFKLPPSKLSIEGGVLEVSLETRACGEFRSSGQATDARNNRAGPRSLAPQPHVPRMACWNCVGRDFPGAGSYP